MSAKEKKNCNIWSLPATVVGEEMASSSFCEPATIIFYTVKMIYDKKMA